MTCRYLLRFIFYHLWASIPWSLLLVVLWWSTWRCLAACLRSRLNRLASFIFRGFIRVLKRNMSSTSPCCSSTCRWSSSAFSSRRCCRLGERSLQIQGCRSVSFMRLGCPPRWLVCSWLQRIRFFMRISLESFTRPMTVSWWTTSSFLCFMFFPLAQVCSVNMRTFSPTFRSLLSWFSAWQIREFSSLTHSTLIFFIW